MIYRSELIFVRLLLPLVIGLLLPFPIAGIHYLWYGNIFLFLILLFIHTWYQEFKFYNYKSLNGSIIFLIFIFLGKTADVSNEEILREDHFSKRNAEMLKISIADEPVLQNGFLRFKARVMAGTDKNIDVKSSGSLMVTIAAKTSETEKLKYGNVLWVPARFTKTEGSKNPGEFDYGGWLAAQNIHHQLFLEDGAYYKTSEKHGNSIIAYAYAVRKAQIARYRKLLKNDAAFSVASTLVLGYRADLSKETIAAYSKTGTIHALSVSGAHVAIVFLFLNFVLGAFGKIKWLRNLRFIITCLVLWGYALLTGLSPSVLRAVIMLTVFITAQTFSKSSNSYNILAFSAFCMLLYNPKYLFHAGFQLSYLAVIGLFWLQPLIYKTLYLKQQIADKLWKLVSLSMAAQLITFPLSIYYFHQFPLYFLIGNLFILLPINMIMGLGAIILLPFTDLLAPCFEWTINFTYRGLQWITELPFSGISGIYIQWYDFFLLFTGTLLLMFAFTVRNKKILTGALTILILMQASLTFSKLNCLNQRRIIYYSLKKGYAAAFIEGNRAWLLTDLKNQHKDFVYHIQPSLDLYRINDIKWVSVKDLIYTPSFKVSQHQIKFFNYRLLIYDAFLNNTYPVNYPAFNGVWLQNNPKIDIGMLRKNLTTNLLSIDATNKPYIADKFAADGVKEGYLIFRSGKDMAYVLDINR